MRRFLPHLLSSLALLLGVASTSSQASPLVTGATYLRRADNTPVVIGQPSIYDYAPSIINDNGTYKMWWCSTVPGVPGDAIRYATSSDGKTWNPSTVVLRPLGNSEESAYAAIGHNCDPSVVKINSTYYMYYTASAADGPNKDLNGQIFLATSSDGVNWTRYPSNSNPQPVIRNTVRDNTYGIGQSTVIYMRGQFYHWYTDTHRNGLMLATSPDGVNFTLQNNGNPVLPVGTVPVFLRDFGMFFAINVINSAIYYFYSPDGMSWTQSDFSESKKVLTGSPNWYNHNGGILTGQTGVVLGNGLTVYYGAGTGDISTWNIEATQLSLRKVPDLLAMQRWNAATYTTEFRLVSGADGYGAQMLHTSSALGWTSTDASWDFVQGDYNKDGFTDIYAIKKVNTGSNLTEVHVLDGGNNFKSFLLQTSIPLAPTGVDSSWVFALGDYNRDGLQDLYCVKKGNTNGGNTEVHVLSGAGNFQTWLLHTLIPMSALGSDDAWNVLVGDHNRDGYPDLYLVQKQTGLSGTTEVHTLSGSSNYQSWLIHSTTALGRTGSDNKWMFSLGDYDGDDVLDLIGVVKSGAGSGRTEVFIMPASNSFQSFALAGAQTPYGWTGSDLSWEFHAR